MLVGRRHALTRFVAQASSWAARSRMSWRLHVASGIPLSSFASTKLYILGVYPTIMIYDLSSYVHAAVMGWVLGIMAEQR